MRRSLSTLLPWFAIAGCGGAPPATVAPVVVAPLVTATPAPTAAPVPDGSVQFAHVPPRVGQRVRVRTEAESRYDELQGEFAGSTYHSDYEAKVLATSGDAITKLEATFHESMRRVLGETEYNEKPTGLAGKTLLVTAPSSVTLADGGALPKDQETLALYVFGELGMRARTGAALPDAPIRLGERVDPFADATVRSLNGVSWTPTRATAVVARASRGVAEIELDLEAKTDSGMSLDAKGTAKVVIATRRTSELVLEGSFRGPPPDRARGRWRVVRTIESDGAGADEVRAP